MPYPPTAYVILKTLKEANCGLTAVKIAELGNIENTSENLRKIQDECYDFSDAGTVLVTDLRGQPNGALFFTLV